MSSLLKNLLLALGLAALLWIGYLVFIEKDEALVESSNSQSASKAVLQGQEFLARLQELKRIDIDGSIFTDPRFNSLQNFRQGIGEEPTGRDNPFAPVE